MKPGKKFGFRFLLILLLWGIVCGFIVGYLAEIGLDELGYPVISPYAGAPLGVGIGIVLSVITYLASLRTIFDYITSLREKLANVGDLPFGFEEDINLEDQANAFYGLFDYEVSRLSEYRNKLELLSDRSRKVIKEAKSRESAPLKNYIQLLEEKFRRVNQIQHKIKRMKEWLRDSVFPVVRVELENLELENLEKFDQMVEFQQELQRRLRQTDRSIQELQEEVEPWQEGGAKLRGTIETANELLLKMSETFRDFPDETLSEQAEKLRQQTQRWDRLADRIETGFASLMQTLEKSHSRIEKVADQARKSTPPAAVWENIKEELHSADNKVNQLKELTRDHWVKSLQKQVDNLQEEAEWLEESLYQIRDEMEDEADTVEQLDKLAGELDEFVTAGEE